MTPEERMALMRRYETKPEDISPEAWEKGEETQRYIQQKIERGEVLQSWSKDNTPIGLDKNLEPFPLTGSDQEQEQGQADEQDQQ